MKRTGPLSRRTALKRTRLKRVNKERKKREYARRFGAKVDAMRETARCAVPGCRPDGWLRDIIDPHHEPPGSDSRCIVWLCRLHHTIRHANGLKRFERAYGIDLPSIAQTLEAEWQEMSG